MIVRPEDGVRNLWAISPRDLATGELQRSGIAVRLQPQPSKLLVLLVQRAGELVTRDEIRQHVWDPGTFVDFDQSVNFCVRQIRSALHDNADTPCYLETLPRSGYQFVAPVQTVSDRPASPEKVKPQTGSQSEPSRRLGQVLLVAGRGEEAIRTLQAAAETTREAPAVLGLLAMEYGERLRHVEARHIVDELERRSATQTVPPGAMTLAYLGIRDNSAAIDALEHGYADRDNYTIYLDVDPLLDSLRNEPRFQVLVQEVMHGSRSRSTKKDRQY